MAQANGIVKHYGPITAHVDTEAKVIRLVLMDCRGDKLPNKTIWKIVTWASNDLGDLLNNGYSFDLSKVGVKRE